MILKTENISKSYKERTVVKGVTIEVNKGEIVGLLGPNGAGKPLLFTIVGLVHLTVGIFVGHHKSSYVQKIKNGNSYLPQEVSIFRKLSVEDNIAILHR